ncbi:MAG: hypothetical protein EAZ09_14435 [Oscillatoriales cyanobacterium]|nr:MAG: hypothetical protein EAZ18_12645 [Oscillatoriales cyanobacterium]TAH20344.1 MAG: hypothetical protein EAZ09_14435 [Oscillatoriales cyanobacterium]
MGIGDWGLGIGNWELGIGNPLNLLNPLQNPLPNFLLSATSVTSVTKSVAELQLSNNSVALTQGSEST